MRARSPDLPTFRRQHPIGLYVLDFYCAKARFAVEIDGRSHELDGRPQHDARRDAWLEARGITVMRIAAADVLADVDRTVDGIMRMAAAMTNAQADISSC